MFRCVCLHGMSLCASVKNHMPVNKRYRRLDRGREKRKERGERERQEGREGTRGERKERVKREIQEGRKGKDSVGGEREKWRSIEGSTVMFIRSNPVK